MNNCNIHPQPKSFCISEPSNSVQNFFPQLSPQKTLAETNSDAQSSYAKKSFTFWTPESLEKWQKIKTLEAEEENEDPNKCWV